MGIQYDELPGWTFEIDEVSAGVYKVKGKDLLGRTVEATGTDTEFLLEQCRKSADSLRIKHE